MTRTFLLALNVESTLDLVGEASQLEDDLLQAGYDVESVKPWASTSPGALEIPPWQPPEHPQPPIRLV